MRKNKIYTLIILVSLSCYTQENIENEEFSYKKDQLIAFGLSGLFSGAGQFYLGDWKKGLIYSSVELMEWAYRFNYLDKNEEYIDLYKEYADQNWGFTKWIKDYYLFNNVESPVYEAFLNDDDGDGIAETFSDPWLGAHGIWFEYCESGELEFCDNGMYISTADPNVMPEVYANICGDSSKDGCDVDEDVINSYVGDILRDHHLYEGIGKYNVYFSGWDDASNSTSWLVDRGNNYKIANSNKKNFYEYVLRKKAKEKSDIAENALSAIFINHAISMLDALLFENYGNNFSISAFSDKNNSYKISGINFLIKIQ